MESGKISKKLFLIALVSLFIITSIIMVRAADCKETDGGRYDYYTKGTCTSSTGAVRTDYCVDSTTVKEFFCWTDQLVYNELKSKSGYVCKDGALVKKQEETIPPDTTNSVGTTPTNEPVNSPESERPAYCPISKYPYACEGPGKVAPSDALRCMTGKDNIVYSSKACLLGCNIKYYAGDKYNILSCINLKESDCNCRDKLSDYGCGVGGGTCYGWKKVCGNDDSIAQTIGDNTDNTIAEEEDETNGNTETESTGKCYCSKARDCVEGYEWTTTDCTGKILFFWSFSGKKCCEKASTTPEEIEESEPITTTEPTQTGCSSKYTDECSSTEVCPRGHQCISQGKTYCDITCKKICSMAYADETVKNKYKIIWCRTDTECECQEKVGGDYGCFQTGQSCYGAKIGCTPSTPVSEDLAPPEHEPTHKKCVNNKCITVDGEGQNECNKDNDCVVQPPEEEYICTDSDGGKDYYVKGITSGRSFVDDNTLISKTDFCVALTGSSAELSQCSGDNCGVYEFECVIAYDKPFVNGNIQVCEYGCEDGACIEEGTETMTIKGNYIILNENFPDDVYSSPIFFYTGGLPTGTKVRTLLDFDLSSLEGKEIKKAELVIKNIAMLYEQDYGKQIVTVHKVTRPWDTSTACWNNKPSFDTTIISSQEITENREYTFSITPIMGYLIEHEAGILLKAEDETKTSLKKFNEAYLNIWYTAEEEETENCEDLGGRCRFLVGCRDEEIYTAGYTCPFWSKCCMPKEEEDEEESQETIDLSDYPYPFVKDDVANFIMIIGRGSSSDDVIAAADILLSLSYSSDTGEPIDIASPLLDNEVGSIKSQNTIIVGGPCVNNAAAELLGMTSEGPECTQGFEEGKAKIKLFQGMQGQGNNVILLVAGYDALRTRIAAKVLANYDEYNLQGQEVIVRGESLEDINIQ